MRRVYIFIFDHTCVGLKRAKGSCLSYMWCRCDMRPSEIVSICLDTF